MIDFDLIKEEVDSLIDNYNYKLNDLNERNKFRHNDEYEYDINVLNEEIELLNRVLICIDFDKEHGSIFTNLTYKNFKMIHLNNQIEKLKRYRDKAKIKNRSSFDNEIEELEHEKELIMKIGR